MILSHHHHSGLVIGLPRTGRTAVARELWSHYDEQEVLHENARYDEFIEVADAAKRRADSPMYFERCHGRPHESWDTGGAAHLAGRVAFSAFTQWRRRRWHMRNRREAR